MTSGRAVVLGDIGPWACAGMTGGRVYVRDRRRTGTSTRDAIERRLGEGAKVTLEELDAEGQLDIEDLLGHYANELRTTDQAEEADRVAGSRVGRQAELPDDHPAEGPGGSVDLDGVTKPTSSTG